MIETIAVFLLGALGAGLVALLVAPMFTRRAARLAERQLRASLPLTLPEIQAQKDLLRADFATQLRKVERRLEQIEQTAAERQIEIGRRDEVLREREIDLAASRSHTAELEDFVEQLKTKVHGLERQVTEQTATLKEKEQAFSAANAELEARTAELEEAKALSDSRKIELVALSTQVDNLNDRIEDLRADLAVKGVAAEERSAEIEELRHELQARDRAIAERNRRIAHRRGLSAARRRQITELRGELSAVRTELATRTLAVEGTEARLEDERRARSELETERERLSGVIVDLEARLELRERELSRLHEQLAEFRKNAEAGHPDMQALRESINDLAARIVSGTAQGGDDEIRKLIDAVSSDERSKRRDSGHVPLAERIKQVDLQPGE